MTARTREPLLAALVAMALALTWSVIDLGGDLDLTTFLRTGEAASARGFVEADLGDVHLVPGWGHDALIRWMSVVT